MYLVLGIGTNLERQRSHSTRSRYPGTYAEGIGLMVAGSRQSGCPPPTRPWWRWRTQLGAGAGP
jgi:hypothetical protein